MAASKHEILLSQLAHKIAMQFQQLFTYVVGFSYPMGRVAMLYDRTGETGRRKSNMAVCRLEIRISQLVHEIASKFQRQYLYVFGVQLTNGNSGNVVRPNGKEPEVE